MAAISIDPVEIRKAEIIAHATVALDGQKNAMQWLQRANPNLADRSPLEVLTHGNREEQQRVDELCMLWNLAFTPSAGVANLQEQIYRIVILR